MYRSTIALLLLLAAVADAQIASLEPSLQLRTVGTVTVPFQNGRPLPSFEKQPRYTMSLAGPWRKMRFGADHQLSVTKRDSAAMASLLAEAAGRQARSFDDAAWALHSVPGVENTLNAYEKVPEYYENGIWYRRSFTVADSLQAKQALLKFYSVNYVADVWLNGQYLGWHEGGYTPFAFDISAALRYDSANVLAVRVDNIPWGSRDDIVPFYRCDWFNYAGIVHDVYVEFQDRLSTVRADLVTQNVDGTMKATVVVGNRNLSAQNVDVQLTVYTAKNDSLSLLNERTSDNIGVPVGINGTVVTSLSVPAESMAVWQTSFGIPSPKLWSPNKPDLYIMKVTLSQGGAVRDEFYTQFGVRTVATLKDRIMLNGKEAFLHGVARHEDHPSYGRTIPVSVILSDLKLVKGFSANYLRTGHYPNHPYTYLAADRLGLIVMEEIPVWWFDDAKSWALQNSARKIHLQMFREMAFRDYNRPSIAMWSLSNESRDVAGRTTFFKMVQDELDGKYPDGRLITQSAAADRPGAYDQSMKQTDVAGWTLYFGIFYDPFGVGEYFGTKYFLVDAHDFYPEKPVIATEFGYWSGETRTRYAQQNEIFDSTYLAFKTRFPIFENGQYNHLGYLAGITWWCIFDWYTHQSNSGFQSMGLMQMNRTDEKPVGQRLRTAYKLFAPRSEYITSVPADGRRPVPTEFSLHQNYPNPFNPATTVRFDLPARAAANLTVYDLLGKERAVLVRETLDAGSYTRSFDARNLPSGVYFVRLTAGTHTAVRKMMLIK